MSLYRQLILILIALFVAGFTGTVAISLNNTRAFLVQQLESHAQDTATSLALSLSPHMQDADLATMESMVDAIFDAGYYSDIDIRGIDAKSLIERRNPTQLQGIPVWFVRLIDLPTPSGEALLMAGWKQAGTVHVTSHPGYAYRELWRNSVQTLWWFAGSLLATLIFAMLVLRYVLRPLRAVEVQAEAICARDYRIQDELPRPRELRRMVEAMNRMVGKVKGMFDEQALLTERLREQAYRDPVTGLGNRRYFNSQLQHLLQVPEEFSEGALLLIQLHDFRGYNDRHGYAAGDALLERAAVTLRARLANRHDVALARLNGADFALLIPHLTGDDADALAGGLGQSLKQLRGSGLDEQGVDAHIGIAEVRSGMSARELISAADMALRSAKTHGTAGWYRLAQDTLASADIRGAVDWQARLAEVIARQQVVLHFQPAMTGSRDILHQEVLLRLPGEQDSLLVAGVFMPQAERAGLARDLDRAAVSGLMRHILAHPNVGVLYAVNLSAGSIQDTGFVDWLCSELEQQPGCAACLVFEVAEYGVLGNVEAMRHFSERISALGAACAIDHFGRGFSAFAYLSTLKVRYVKIDGSYVRGIDANKDNQFFVQALVKTLHGIDLQVIAENVETEAEEHILRDIGVDGLQGYRLAKPSASLIGEGN